MRNTKFQYNYATKIASFVREKKTANTRQFLIKVLRFFVCSKKKSIPQFSTMIWDHKKENMWGSVYWLWNSKTIYYIVHCICTCGVCCRMILFLQHKRIKLLILSSYLTGAPSRLSTWNPQCPFVFNTISYSLRVCSSTRAYFTVNENILNMVYFYIKR